MAFGRKQKEEKLPEISYNAQYIIGNWEEEPKGTFTTLNFFHDLLGALKLISAKVATQQMEEPLKNRLAFIKENLVMDRPTAIIEDPYTNNKYIAAHALYEIAHEESVTLSSKSPERQKAYIVSFLKARPKFYVQNFPTYSLPIIKDEKLYQERLKKMLTGIAQELSREYLKESPEAQEKRITKFLKSHPQDSAMENILAGIHNTLNNKEIETRVEAFDADNNTVKIRTYLLAELLVEKEPDLDVLEKYFQETKNQRINNTHQIKDLSGFSSIA